MLSEGNAAIVDNNENIKKIKRKRVQSAKVRKDRVPNDVINENPQNLDIIQTYNNASPFITNSLGSLSSIGNGNAAVNSMYVLNNGSTKMISDSENAAKAVTIKGFRIQKRQSSAATTGTGTGTTTSKN